MSSQTKQRSDPSTEERPRLARLVLTGFMGAGKSTVGPLLAQTLGWRFEDLDCAIEAHCGQSVAAIFRERGEAYFRRQERLAAERFQKERELVLALGGGALEDGETLAAFLGSPGSCLVFLDAPLPELVARIREGEGVRPLLASEEELAARLRSRLPQYRSAHLIVPTAGLPPQEVAARILSLVRQRWLA